MSCCCQFWAGQPTACQAFAHVPVRHLLSYVHSGDKRAPLAHNAAVTACQAVAKDLIKELQAWKQSRYAAWNESTVDRLDSIKMDQSGKLMDMNSRDGRIKLHYNEDLVVMLREVSITIDRSSCAPA